MMQTPVGELATFGVGKETTFGTYAAPTIFHELQAFSPSVKNTMIAREGSVGAAGMRPMPTGPLEITGSLRVATLADIHGQLMAYAMGSQSAPVSYQIATTTNSSNYTGGSTSLIVTSASGLTVGLVCSIAGDANKPTITAISGTTLTLSFGGFASSHSSGTTIIFSSPTAYSTSLTFGLLRQLPSFSMEYGFPASNTTFSEYLDYTGCCIDTMKVALSTGKDLQIDYTWVGVNQLKQTSPVTPTLSTKNPMTMEASGTATSLNNVSIGTATSPPDVRSWDLTLNNQIDKKRRSAGAGRFPTGWPLGPRKVSGSLKLGFESEAARLLFWGSNSATSPAAFVPGVPLTLNVGCQDVADATNGVRFLVSFTMPNVYLTQADVPHVVSGSLEQTANFTATESAPGANNDLSIALIDTNGFGW
jgi:hypothetical protein